jgi:uncharacterized protein (TIRG00374 family)
VKRRYLWNTLKYLLAFGVLGYVVYKHRVWDEHIVQGKPINGWDLALGFGLYLAAVLITLVRWYLLVRAQDLPFTLPAAFRVGFIGFFYNMLLPGSVGGDIVKAAVLAREQSRRTVAVATVIMDRVIALWGLFWFVALFGSGFWMAGLLDGASVEPARLIVLVAVTVVAVSVVVWGLLGLLPQWRAERFADRLSRIPKVGIAAAEFWRAVWMYRCRQQSVALAMGLSWISQGGIVLSFFFCSKVLWDGEASNPIPTLAQHFLLVPIGMVVSAIPLFPSGMGIGEAAFGSLYGLFAGAKAEATGILGSLVQRVVSWVIGIGGFLCVRSPASKSQPATSSPQVIETTETNVLPVEKSPAATPSTIF